MATEQIIEYARKALPVLVNQARTRKTITYKELSTLTGAHFHAVLPNVLGYIRDDICIPQGLPLITAIVVNQDTGKPGHSFLPEGTTRLSKEEYDEAFKNLRDQVFAYRDWEKLLFQLGLEPIKATPQDLDQEGKAYTDVLKRVGGGEQGPHLRLKEYVAAHPECLGLQDRKHGEMEHGFIAGDECDVLFDSTMVPVIAEIKVGHRGELVKGVYQAVKYRALIEAERGHGEPIAVRCFLVAYDEIPDDIREFAGKFKINCVAIPSENIEVQNGSLQSQSQE